MTWLGQRIAIITSTLWTCTNDGMFPDKTRWIQWMGQYHRWKLLWMTGVPRPIQWRLGWTLLRQHWSLISTRWPTWLRAVSMEWIAGWLGSRSGISGTHFVLVWFRVSNITSYVWGWFVMESCYWHASQHALAWGISSIFKRCRCTWDTKELRFPYRIREFWTSDILFLPNICHSLHLNHLLWVNLLVKLKDLKVSHNEFSQFT